MGGQWALFQVAFTLGPTIMKEPLSGVLLVTEHKDYEEEYGKYHIVL